MLSFTYIKGMNSFIFFNLKKATAKLIYAVAFIIVGVTLFELTPRTWGPEPRAIKMQKHLPSI